MMGGWLAADAMHQIIAPLRMQALCSGAFDLADRLQQLDSTWLVYFEPGGDRCACDLRQHLMRAMRTPSYVPYGMEAAAVLR